MGVDIDREQRFFEEYDPEALEKIIETQFRVADQTKEQGKHVYKGIIIDDFAGQPKFTRKSNLVHQLYIRGRHALISTITSV